MLAGTVMQFVNIKVILYGITALSSFILPYSRSLFTILWAILMLSLAGFLGTSCWALFGSLFQSFFERYRKPMNLVMALLPVYCAVMSLVN